MFMALTEASRNPAEYAPLDELYAPIIHRVNQAIRARAIHEDGPIDEIPPVLLKYEHPPDGLIKQAKRKIDRLIEVANVKRGQLTETPSELRVNTDMMSSTSPGEAEI